MDAATKFFVAGILLLATEIFITGFGICGLAGIFCFLAAIYLFLGGTLATVGLLSLLYAALVVVLLLIYKKMAVQRHWNLLVLLERQKGNKGAGATTDYSSFLGKKGTALTLLRPAGTALVAGSRLDVLTEGEFLPVGTALTVIKVEGSKIVVAKTAAAS